MWHCLWKDITARLLPARHVLWLFLAVILPWTDATFPWLDYFWRLAGIRGVRGWQALASLVKECQFVDHGSYMQENVVVSSETRGWNMDFLFAQEVHFVMLPQLLEHRNLVPLCRTEDNLLIMPQGSMLNRDCTYLYNTCSLNWENFWIKQIKFNKINSRKVQFRAQWIPWAET